jgi:serine/threonine-protein kinase
LSGPDPGGILDSRMTCPACKAENLVTAEVCASCGQALSPSRVLRQGSVVASRYEILSMLGQGGMGAVYRAHDRLLDEPVAIKVLRPDVAREPDIARRFQSEIKLARRVSHKNVCRIHEYGDDQGLRYISMEFLEGVDLRQLVREKGGLPPAEAFDVALQVCDGLAAIHEVGVIHRDLKTPNIMRDKRGLLRLMDFGIAKESGVDGTATATGLIIGTPEYMSPEQARGERIDFRSDIYALGIVIFEIFTGRVPFRSDTPLGIILKHLQEPPPLDGPEAAAVPAAVKDVLRSALAKTAAERYGSVAEMAEALRHARAVTLGQTPLPVTAVPVAVTAVASPTAVAAPTAAGAPVTTSSAPTLEGPAPTASPRAQAPARPAPPPIVPRPMPAATQMRARRGPSPLVFVLAGVGLAGIVLVGIVVAVLGLFGEREGTTAQATAPRQEPVATTLPIATPQPEPTPARVASNAPAVTPDREPTQPVERTPVRTSDRMPARPVETSPVRPVDPTPPPAPQVHPAVMGHLAALGSRDANERWHAAEALGNLGSGAKAAVPALLAALEDRSEVVRWRSAEALGKIGSEAAMAVAGLKTALADPDGLVKTEAAKALGKIGAPARSAVPALADPLRSSDAFLRREAAKALARIVGPESSEAVPVLADALRDKDKFVRMECARALGRIGPEARAAVPALTGALKDKEPLVAKEADDALQSINGVRP